MARTVISPAARPGAVAAASDGFTLFELLIVLAIMGVLASFTGVAVIRAVQGNTLDRVTVEIERDLRQARLQAVRDGVDRELVISSSGYRISGPEGAGEEQSWPRRVRAGLQEYRRTGWQDVASVRIPARTIPLYRFRLRLERDGGHALIQFDPVSGEVRHEPDA